MSRGLASSPEIPPLGIGIVHSRAVSALIAERCELLDVVEVEPQTSWLQTDDQPPRYRPDREVLEEISDLPLRKIVHSVGAPVGGTVVADSEQLRVLAEVVEVLQPPWVSEHLAFNRTPDHATGFFLPPRLTESGARHAINSIGRLRDAVGRPVAIETGVSYLQPRSDEMADGDFVALVADGADCGILLDLHNIWCNDRNGRQAVDSFLSCLPLERVWEIHMAGGMEVGGFWLDAHSGPSDPQLIDVARRIIPQLPNLGAIVFEILPSYVPAIGIDRIAQELVMLRDLWALRVPAAPHRPRNRSPVVHTPDGAIAPQDWEGALGALAVGRPDASDISDELAGDPGIAITKWLIEQFRASMLVAVLPLSTRFLLLSIGRPSFERLMQAFWQRTPPLMYGSAEGRAFGGYLQGLDLAMPRLEELLAFELATIETLIDSVPRVVGFEVEPIPLVRALLQGHLPADPLQAGAFEIEVTAEEATTLVIEPGLSPS